MQLHLPVIRVLLMLQNWVSDKVLSVKLAVLMLLEVASPTKYSAYMMQGADITYTGTTVNHEGKTGEDATGLLPCPWCGELPCDMSSVTDENELDKYLIHRTFPVACCNPKCVIQPHSDNISWNNRPVPNYVVEEMKDAFNKYSISSDDVLVVPNSYLQQTGLSKELLDSYGIKHIIFPGNILLKPAIVKTAGYNY